MSLIDLRATNLAREYVAHAHGHHQLILATRGATELSIEGSGERVTGSRGCLIPCSHHHEYLGDGNNRTFVLDIPVASLPSLRDASEMERLFDKPRFFGVPPELNRLADSLMQQLEQCPALHSEIAALLLRALYLHLESQPLSEQGAAYAAGRDGRLDMPSLDAWIDRHLAEEIRVESLATQCALSVGHFHACFRDRMGMTPLAYVQQRRLNHARTLVNHSGLSLGQIAALVGFRDQGSFSRAYRRAFEVSPSSERRLHEALARG
ncbi:AraC family transcriptional regulator [Halomonas sp. 18H]|uniref:AraC family transcriptional regulator n=1 Tax=Halomonas almeriensis TaxID=308163 RepID=UPI002230D58A|nr:MULTISPECIES: AraC family transcriptional regulator [Halomonas]MCW4153351.1 AraC family transcriptional regulator [Halomonas sp. 18H]MDN3553778.1 AraC family transcriptional regulator [Halomonas almeriensis]